MYSVDDLNLTAYGRKLPQMMYKPIIAHFWQSAAVLIGVAAIRLEPVGRHYECKSELFLTYAISYY